MKLLCHERMMNHAGVLGAVAMVATMRSVLFSGALLIGIIIIRSVQVVLMELVTNSTLFLAHSAGAQFRKGIDSLVLSAHYMRPVVFFSALLLVHVVVQCWALVYIDLSTFVVVLQLLVIFVAIAERVLLKRELSAVL
eukprot:238141-Amphidinium_carterae.2